MLMVISFVLFLVGTLCFAKFAFVLVCLGPFVIFFLNAYAVDNCTVIIKCQKSVIFALALLLHVPKTF